MEIQNYFEILFGAFLGFGFTFLLQSLNIMGKKNRLKKILSMEIDSIKTFLDGFIKSYKLGEKTGKFFISQTEVPNFNYVS